MFEFYKHFPSAGRNRYFHCWSKRLPLNIWNKQTTSWINCLLGNGELGFYDTASLNRENLLLCGTWGIVEFGDCWTLRSGSVRDSLNFNYYHWTEAVADRPTFRSMISAAKLLLIAWNCFKHRICDYGQRIIRFFPWRIGTFYSHSWKLFCSEAKWQSPLNHVTLGSPTEEWTITWVNRSFWATWFQLWLEQCQGRASFWMVLSTFFLNLKAGLASQ